MQALVIDDSPTNVLVIKGMVKSIEGIDVVSFTDPGKALEWVEINTPDIALVDYMMPDIDGLDVIKRLRSLEHTRDIPIIMISAAGDKKVVYQALELGANDFLPKPIDKIELLARIKNMMIIREAQAKLQNYATSLAHEVEVATRDLQISEERYMLAAKGANDGLWDWNIQTGEVFFSPRWTEMLGYREDEVIPSIESIFSRIHMDDIDALKSELDYHFSHSKEHLNHECRIRHKNGYYRWVLIRGLVILDEQNTPQRFVGSQTDITDKKRVEEQLLYNAFYDQLTGLANRSLFLDRLSQALLAFQRDNNTHFSVLFLDLDKFKNVNDTLGHQAGDEFLITIGNRIKDCCRAVDTVARLGGDEFTVLCNGINGIEEATQFASRVMSEVSKPLIIRGHEVFPTISVGIVTSSANYSRADEIIRDADFALYQAKAKGVGLYEVFDSHMQKLAARQFKIENSLRTALKNDEIKTFYQPIIHLGTKSVAGFEALIRWDSPKYGLVPPLDFIQMAEENHMISDLGDFIFSSASQQLIQWQNKYKTQNPWFMSINVSPKQIEKVGYIENVYRLIKEIGVNPHDIKLEMTESMLISSPQKAKVLIRDLKALGLSISIDDFGTGYSSLSTLYDFPFDTIKIDRSFVTDIHESKKAQRMMRIMTLVASALEMNMIVEGIEKEEELDWLKPTRHSYGQGYLFSKPLPAHEIEAYLESLSPELLCPPPRIRVLGGLERIR